MSDVKRYYLRAAIAIDSLGEKSATCDCRPEWKVEPERLESAEVIEIDTCPVCKGAGCQEPTPSNSGPKRT